ncbi:MAG TPA: hypothetical protein VER33_13635 [Polyangiaceae bacterium]|nr:hypothetical protein [Polyangiaceae bacterium]
MAANSGMTSESGVRFELRLETAADGGARYAVELTLAAATLSGQAQILPAGDVLFHWSGEESPPTWCISIVRAQLRTLWRDQGSRGAFPRRLTRWRPVPEKPNG